MTQAADVLSFLLLLFSSYPAALLQRQFHAQVARLPRRRIRWLAAFTTGQFLPRAEPRLSSLLRGASFVPAYLPFLQPLLPARRSVDSFCRARKFAVLMLEAAYIHHAIALGDLRKVQKEIPE